MSIASSAANSKDASKAVEGASGTYTWIKKVADIKNTQNNVSISRM